MTNKTKKAVAQAKASRIKASEQWQRVSKLSTEVRAQVFAAEASWIAWDAQVILAEARDADHPLVDIIAYYAKQAEKHAIKSSSHGCQGQLDDAQSELIGVKTAHREAKETSEIRAELVEVIDRIAVWSCIWQNAQSLDYPQIYVSGRGYDKKDAIHYVRTRVDKMQADKRILNDG